MMHETSTTCPEARSQKLPESRKHRYSQVSLDSKRTQSATCNKELDQNRVPQSVIVINDQVPNKLVLITVSLTGTSIKKSTVKSQKPK
jgi:hypothetical protein